MMFNSISALAILYLILLSRVLQATSSTSSVVIQQSNGYNDIDAKENSRVLESTSLKRNSEAVHHRSWKESKEATLRARDDISGDKAKRVTTRESNTGTDDLVDDVSEFCSRYDDSQWCDNTARVIL